MNESVVIITFSNGEKLYLDTDSIIYPINLIKDDSGVFTSKGQAIFLGEHYHHHDGYIPKLTEIISTIEYFSVGTDDSFEATIYKASSVVSFKQS